MKKSHLVLLLLALGLVTHFIYIQHPDSTVFDEVHFGKFISGYYTHEYFFDIHPPLGKLIIAGFGKLFDFDPNFSFAEIGQEFPDDKYIALRFLPRLAGALLPLVVFLLALEIGIAPIAAFFAGIFIGLDNALLTQSIYILLDSFLLLFGVLGLYFYFKYKNTEKKGYLLWMAIFGAFAVSIKWTGASFLALAFVIEFVSLIKNRKLIGSLGRLMSFFVAIPILIYFSVFVVHFKLLTHSGPGDAFMSGGFKKTLIGSDVYEDSFYKPQNIIDKFVELNTEMYRANQRLDATHAYSSKWYTWPFMTRPIFYWVQDQARIYLLGNPVVWWLSTCAVIYLLLSMLQKDPRFKGPIPYFLMGGYALNLLPFVGVQRVMFLYHYFIPLIFAVLMLAYLVGRTKKPKKNVLILSVLALLAFIYFAPLSYGLHLDPAAYENRVWLESWR